MQDIHLQFRAANQSAGSEILIEFLDAASGVESVQECQRRMLELCPPHPGQRILDLGCGLGHSALKLAAMVGPAGSVIGIDRNRDLIAEARRRAADLSDRLTFEVGDIQNLDFPTNSFDMCRVERVLMYVDNPQLIVDGMLRLLRPRGRLIFFEFDYDSAMVDAPDSTLTRKLGRLIADSIPNPCIGRQLLRLLHERDVRNIQVIPHTVMTSYPMYRTIVSGTIERAIQAGQFDPPEVENWWRSLEEAESAGHFFAAFPGFIVYGQAT